MEYRSVTRDETNKIDLTIREETINASLLTDSRHGVYVSDNARIKPKELDRVEKQISKGLEATGVDGEKVNYVIVGDTEFSSTAGGRFDPDTQTVFIKPMADKDLQQHVVMHELFHCRDYQDFTSGGGTYTTKDEYVSLMSQKAKAKLDKKGINAYNVNKISDYAAISFRRGRYDETYTEYRAASALRQGK